MAYTNDVRLAEPYENQDGLRKREHYNLDGEGKNTTRNSM